LHEPQVEQLVPLPGFAQPSLDCRESGRRALRGKRLFDFVECRAVHQLWH